MNPAFSASHGGEGGCKSDECPLELIFSRIELFRTMARLDIGFGGNYQVV
jgi:hypothetical protein